MPDPQAAERVVAPPRRGPTLLALACAVLSIASTGLGYALDDADSQAWWFLSASALFLLGILAAVAASWSRGRAYRAGLLAFGVLLAGVPILVQLVRSAEHRRIDQCQAVVLFELARQADPNIA